MTPGDVLGHEAMGIVEEVGPAAGDLQLGDRVVVPFNISCGHCSCASAAALAMRDHPGPRARHRRGAVRLHEAVRPGAGGQAEYLRVPQAALHPHQGADGPLTTGSSICPTSCPLPGRRWSTRTCRDGGTLVVLGLGPIGDMAAASPSDRAHRVIGVDLVPERLARAASAASTSSISTSIGRPRSTCCASSPTDAAPTR